MCVVPWFRYLYSLVRAESIPHVLLLLCPSLPCSHDTLSPLSEPHFVLADEQLQPNHLLAKLLFLVTQLFDLNTPKKETLYIRELDTHNL